MRLRKPSPLDPAVAAELAVVDAALRGDPVGPEQQQLRDLVLAVRDAAPRARPEFMHELGAAVEAGVPNRATPPRSPRGGAAGGRPRAPGALGAPRGRAAP